MDSSPRTSATVEFENVTKRFDGRKGSANGVDAAVYNLSLTVHPGEICVLVGPSGCGKTTTLKMANRLIEPTSGRVLIDGEDISTVDAVQLRRSIGYVIQQIGLFPHKTIAENIATVPRLLKWPEERIRRRVDELLDLVGLAPDQYRDRYPAQLSGGERQRVGVARGMAAEPPLMLMDEPFGAVDPLVRSRLQDEFLRIQRQLRITVIFVTHDIDEAIKLGSRVAVMERGGKIAQYSTPAEILAHPASDYVARFVGSDRSLKRLAVMTVAELPLRASPRPADAPVLRPEMTARDALSLLLTAPDETGVVIDAAGAYHGVISVSEVGAALRAAIDGNGHQHPEPNGHGGAPA